jgi:hypothetical protein
MVLRVRTTQIRDMLRRIAPLKRLWWRIQPLQHIAKRHRRKREAEEQRFEDMLGEVAGNVKTR